MAWLELPPLFLFCSFFEIVEEEWVGGRRPRAPASDRAAPPAFALQTAGSNAQIRARRSEFIGVRFKATHAHISVPGSWSSFPRIAGNPGIPSRLGSGSSLRFGRNAKNNFVVKGLSYSCACRRLQREGATTSDRSPRPSIPELVRISCIRPAYPRKQR